MISTLIKTYQQLSPAKLAFGSGLIIALAFPPMPWPWLAWFGLVPLIHSFRKTDSPSKGAWLGFVWAMGFLPVVIYWMALNSGTVWWAALVSMIAAVLFLSLNYAFLGWWFVWLKGIWGKSAELLLPAIWLSVELVRTYGTLGFPWISLANSQAQYLYLIQNAEYTGIYGITFWVVAVNVCLANLNVIKPLKIIPTTIVVLVLPWLTGYALLPDVPAATLKIGIVQPNTNPLEKWDPEIKRQHFNQLARLTIEAAAYNPKLVIWPEAATPAYLRRGGRAYLAEIKELLGELELTVLTGMPDYERGSDGSVSYFNSVGLIDSNGISQRYDKIHLVPFGEYIPLSGLVPSLKKLNLGQGNFNQGQAYTVFNLGDTRFGAEVCYETTIPGLNRQLVQQGAEFLVAVVNDAWFGISSEQFQHTVQFRYRAVELRRPVVRCANTGISIVYDQARHERVRKGMAEEGVIIAEIAPSSDQTFYLIYGNLMGWIIFIMAAGFTIIGVRVSKTELKHA